MTKTLTKLVLSTAMVATAACASSDKPAGFAGATDIRGAEGSVLSAAWEDGKELETKGLKLVADSNKMLVVSERKEREGEELVVSGKAQVAAQKFAYSDAVRAFGLASTPKQVKAEVSALRGIAERWDNGLDDINRGERLIKESGKETAEASAKKRKGEQMIADGRAQMRGVETRAVSASERTETPFK